MRISNLMIGARLGIAFGTLCVLITSVGVAGAVAMHTLKRDLDVITKVNNTKNELIVTLRQQVHITNRVSRTIIILDDIGAKNKEALKISAARASYDSAWKQLQSFEPTAEERRLRAAIELTGNAAMAINEKLLALGLSQRDADARGLLLTQVIPLNTAWLKALNDSADFQLRASLARVETAGTTFGRGLWWIGLIALGAVMFAAWAGWFISRTITLPIHYARECALRMAGGDLTRRVERRKGFDGKDETSELIAAMQTMHDSLCDMVASVHANASGVASAAEQIAMGNLDLSNRTEVQAANLEETAATMDQLTATVRGNSASTVQAATLASGAGSVAGKGGRVMHDVVQTMSGIDASSKKIAEIIGAAREIKSLIHASVDQVGAGTALVRQAGTTMAEIVTAIDHVNLIMGEIQTSTREQTDGISQVGQAVGEMDRATQQNAALVEQSAAAAASLNRQAKAMMEVVGRFRLGTA